MRRTIAVVAGVLAVLLGALFTFQGLGLAGGSFMTGDRLWVVIGIVLAVVGFGVIDQARRRPGRTGRHR